MNLRAVLVIMYSFKHGSLCLDHIEITHKSNSDKLNITFTFYLVIEILNILAGMFLDDVVFDLISSLESQRTDWASVKYRLSG